MPPSATISRICRPITVFPILRETTKTHLRVSLYSWASWTCLTVRSEAQVERPEGSIGMATKSAAMMQERAISSA